MKKDDVTYDSDLLCMTCPDQWNVVYRLKGKLAKDSYRIHYKLPGSTDRESTHMIVAASDSFEDILQDWQAIVERVLPEMRREPGNITKLEQLLKEVRESFSGSRDAYRKSSTTDALREQRNLFEARLKQLVEGVELGPAKTLNDYQIFRTLGTGSFGRVLLCRVRCARAAVACIRQRIRAATATA